MAIQKNKAQFSIRYEGPAVASGAMDVSDFAPALLALGDLVAAANRELNPDRQITVKTYVTATSKSSFGALLEIVQGNLPLLVDATFSYVATASDLKSQLFGRNGLLPFIKEAAGRHVTKEGSDEEGKPIVRFEGDNNTINIEPTIYNLYSDKGARESVEAVVEPLKREGIQTLSFDDVSGPFAIEESESEYFALPRGSVLVDDNTTTRTLSIVALSFIEGQTWRLSDGSTIYYATIEDEEFWTKVVNREVRFAAGDILVCEFRTRTWLVGMKPNTKHAIVKALDTVERRTQPPTTGKLF